MTAPADIFDGTLLRRPRATVDLDALAGNYRLIIEQLAGVPAAAVVKANGYGLGATAAATRLWAEGCTRFFVARADEAVDLRHALPDAEINVFDGLLPGTDDEMLDYDLVPILNSIEQLGEWRRVAVLQGRELAAGIHIDTGMRRLGLPPDEFELLCRQPELLNGIELRHVLSHLASADVASSEQSAEQLKSFRAVRERLPMGTASLANSAGIFLGPEYHFDLARPGISLYGGSPFPDSGKPNPMHSVLTVEAPIIQVRRAESGESVGYGATHRVGAPARIATVPVGYADGFLRSSSNQGVAAIAGRPVPIVGRISMDLITIDVSAVHDLPLRPGTPVELVGPNCPIDEVAERAGSIPHEFLTNLSRRFELQYLGLPPVGPGTVSRTESHSH